MAVATSTTPHMVLPNGILKNGWKRTHRYRRQVKTIRENVKAILTEVDNMPLIDTVERMQGQSVEIVILNMSITNSAYYEQQSSFVLEPHRLNVMISRAKCKVVLNGKYNREV